MSDDRLEQNKQVVKRLIDELFTTDKAPNLKVIDELVAKDYLQHNPFAGQGPEGLRQFVSNFYPVPDWLAESYSIAVNYIAEGDLVVRQDIRNHGMLIDIFRVKDGLLQEHWDAYRPNADTDRLPGF